MSSPRVPLSPNLGTFTDSEALRTPSSRVLWRLRYVGAIDESTGHWQLIEPPVPLPCPEVRGGTESSHPLIAFPWVRSKCHLINMTRDTSVTLDGDMYMRVCSSD